VDVDDVPWIDFYGVPVEIFSVVDDGE